MNSSAIAATPYDALLIAATSPSQSPARTRILAEYDEMETLRDSLLVTERSYRQQYANLYFVRLIMLRPPVLAAATARWGELQGNPKHVNKVLDVQQGQACYIIGTVYMEMPLKPNILDDITKENWIAIPPPRPKYISDKDRVTLEDESGRIVLTGSRLKKETLVTGIIIAVLGSETTSGEFEVLDICLPDLAPQPSFNPMETGGFSENSMYCMINLKKLGIDYLLLRGTNFFVDEESIKYVALVSGLNIGNNTARMTELQLLAEYLTGELGGELRKYGYDSTAYDASPVLELDAILQDICASVDVDLMPGAHDPAMVHLPQQPLQRAMFSRTAPCSTFRTVTNPYWCKSEGVTYVFSDDMIDYDGYFVLCGGLLLILKVARVLNSLVPGFACRFLGSSGQPVDDIFKYVENDDNLQLAERTLFWRHMAPSAPDTLCEY
ncbi:DNA polymerase delta small subunit [Endogone sp. FLAS-F59071]|nr:DNA polymerase delta small subunit [Endogone sp. FLAS-F59071]|eukprot:RUS20370.1 DNA polymerase delta small subunit [Endogone sp. FLAS-F59071]